VKMARSLVASFAFLLTANFAAAQQGGVCFGANRNRTFVGHETKCDHYYACDIDGNATPRQCPNGMAFYDSEYNINEADFCIYENKVDCTGLTLEAPITRGHCYYLNGYFPDDQKCDIYYLCTDGEATQYQCGPGLAYDTVSGICDWIDKVPECKAQRDAANLEAGFTCPDTGRVAQSGSFTRHAHPDDCRQYYVCFDGVPRSYGCPIGTVYQIGAVEGEGKCALPEDVEGCEKYYGDANLAEIQLLNLG